MASHTAKCEICEVEVQFRTYKHDWPKGWAVTGLSRWGKKYQRRTGHAWWCPRCGRFAGNVRRLRAWLALLPLSLRDGILAHLPGLADEQVLLRYRRRPEVYGLEGEETDGDAGEIQDG